MWLASMQHTLMLNSFIHAGCNSCFCYGKFLKHVLKLIIIFENFLDLLDVSHFPRANLISWSFLDIFSRALNIFLSCQNLYLGFFLLKIHFYRVKIYHHIIIILGHICLEILFVILNTYQIFMKCFKLKNLRFTLKPLTGAGG